MFGIRYIWSCVNCHSAWKFKSKRKHRAFSELNNHHCPKCGMGLSQAPLMHCDIPMPTKEQMGFHKKYFG